MRRRTKLIFLFSLIFLIMITGIFIRLSTLSTESDVYNVGEETKFEEVEKIVDEPIEQQEDESQTFADESEILADKLTAMIKPLIFLSIIIPMLAAIAQFLFDRGGIM